MSGEVAVSPAWFGDTVYLANEYARLLAVRPGPPAEVVWESNLTLTRLSPALTDFVVMVRKQRVNSDIGMRLRVKHRRNWMRMKARS